MMNIHDSSRRHPLEPRRGLDALTIASRPSLATATARLLTLFALLIPVLMIGCAENNEKAVLSGPGGQPSSTLDDDSEAGDPGEDDEADSELLPGDMPAPSIETAPAAEPKATAEPAEAPAVIAEPEPATPPADAPKPEN